MDDDVADSGAYAAFSCAMTRLAALGPSRFVVALSGGLDSVTLTRLACLWRRETGCGVPFVAAHVNHGLRGDDSDGDARFCRELARGLGLDYVVASADAAAVAAAENIGLEEAGRRIRYRFFAALAGEDGIVLTGHHADDQVETILLNLRRGTHARGLAGMRDYGVVAVPDAAVRVARPLLGIAKNELETLANAAGWSWREDATNRDTVFARNRIRHRVVPILEKLAPGFSKRLLRRAGEMRAVDDRWTTSGKELLARICRREHNGVFVEVTDAVLADKELFSYALRELVEQETRRPFPGNKTLSRLLHLAACGLTNETTALPGGDYYVRREYDGLFLFPTQTNSNAAADTGLTLPPPPFMVEYAGLTITAEMIPDGVPMPDADMHDATVQWIRANAIDWPLRLRPPEPGERFRALGAPGARKIHDILIDLKVPRRERSIPRVVADEKEALWIWPLRLSHNAKLPNRKGPAVRIQIKKSER